MLLVCKGPLQTPHPYSIPRLSPPATEPWPPSATIIQVDRGHLCGLQPGSENLCL